MAWLSTAHYSRTGFTMAEQVRKSMSSCLHVFNTLCRSRKLSRSNIFSKMPKSEVRLYWTQPKDAYLSCQGGKKVSTKDKRWYKDVGLGFKTPSDAIHGTYIGMCIPAHSAHYYMCIHRQEMSLYRQRLHSWANPGWQGRIHKDDTDSHRPPGLPPLRP